MLREVIVLFHSANSATSREQCSYQDWNFILGVGEEATKQTSSGNSTMDPSGNHSMWDVVTSLGLFGVMKRKCRGTLRVIFKPK